jgi:glutamate/tyrosine decarboxylase-like PLP-dependent enzyme
MSNLNRLSAWFAGPKAENGDWFADTLRRIADDYYAWRRNYFPEDGVVVTSSLRRENEDFTDRFQDRLIELLGRLKADVPFQSPRYAAHMLAEQTLPSIAGYFAAMLYNPNNITADVAPVTVRLEHQAGQMLCRMIGYGGDSWAHLTSGGTVANLEALWVARTVRYLPFILRDMRREVGLPPLPWLDDPTQLLGLSPATALTALETTFREAAAAFGAGSARRLINAYVGSEWNPVENGLAAVCARAGSSPVLLAPETHHYCFEKALDVLGLGRRALVPVRVDSRFRMCPEDLEATLDRVEAEGRHVLAVVAVVGSTEEGSVDPVDAIVDLRARRERAGKSSFWLHADGAYGGYLRTVTIPDRIGLGEARATVQLAGVERDIPIQLPEHDECRALEALPHADSVTIDPHKLGYIPYPAGAVCFRSDLIKPITRQDAPYLDDAAFDLDADRRSGSIGLYVLEGSKPGAAAAAVWLSHSLIPLDTSGHGLLIRETIRNACELHGLLESYPELASSPAAKAVCLCPPGSNIVCYAFRPREPGASLEQINSLNREIHDRFSIGSGDRVYDQSFFVSRTTLSPRQYSLDTVGGFLDRLGVSHGEYAATGVFLLRSVLMNPWYSLSKQRGRYFLSEMVEELYRVAADVLTSRR